MGWFQPVEYCMWRLCQKKSLLPDTIRSMRVHSQHDYLAVHLKKVLCSSSMREVYSLHYILHYDIAANLCGQYRGRFTIGF